MIVEYTSGSRGGAPGARPLLTAADLWFFYAKNANFSQFPPPRLNPESATGIIIEDLLGDLFSKWFTNINILYKNIPGL